MPLEHFSTFLFKEMQEHSGRILSKEKNMKGQSSSFCFASPLALAALRIAFVLSFRVILSQVTPLPAG